MIQIDLEHILIILGIPSALTGLFFWALKRKIEKAEEERKKQEEARREREKNREELLIGLIEGVNAAVSLSEATAKAVQRIPDAKCNGDMHAALDYATKVKNKQKTFLTQKGIEAILD